MTNKTKTVLKRFARTTGATLLGALIGFLTGPDAANLIPSQYAVLVSAVAIPLLVAADKWLRFGSDAGEGDTQIPTPKA